MRQSELSQRDVRDYLDRIGVGEPGRADAGTLTLLQDRHLAAVPFENLSIHLGEPLVLEPGALLEKIVHRRRGGFCYELNGLFAELLTALGFEVSPLAARVFRPDGSLGPPFDHLVLWVHAGEPWLVDVGFGAHSRDPLRVQASGEQLDADGVFVVSATGDGDLDVSKDGQPQYRVETRPRALADFAAMCFYQAHSPDSHFSGSLVCSLRTDDGRLTLSGDQLIRTAGGARTETALTPEELLPAYRDLFGIALSEPPSDPRVLLGR
jgi:N-hydroxyarylamine O-acetyltransferase